MNVPWFGGLAKHGLILGAQNDLGDGFKRFFIFIPIWGNDPI